ncbi:ACP S-malonyltransferase [Pseudaquidulcibacter saccharophilus]|uniref:ACP S-malonyltransferase n=1 Tax=Pseudaquidulcibacter saccharophilus TaxID=2831900 RepID=UPI001EFF0A41|nr:ACP S-malonyltransferase [Pseudaquidulcibacter saccharophilus]
MFIIQFPGQGSQAVGMGAALAQEFDVAKRVFQEVDDALGQKLSDLMFNGPIETLTLTENAQPAIMASSIAIVKVLEAEFGFDVATAKYVAGHSLGEYTALTAAKAFSISDAAKLLKLRGQSMQAAVPAGQGAMASLIGPKVDIALAEAAAAEGAKAGVCTVANDNNAGNVVISGTKEGVDAAIAAAKEMGARAIPLNVSAPFHCPLMQPAAEAMAKALADVQMNAPITQLVPNVSLVPTTDVETIKKLLVEQVTGRVRWRETLGFFSAQGIDTLVEIGSGNVLTGMSKRTIADANHVTVSTADDIRAFSQNFPK